MFSKAQLFVIIGFLLTYGCKNIGIDYSALEDRGDSPSNPWAMVDMFLLESDDGGEIMLVLSEHLKQEANIRGLQPEVCCQRHACFCRT